MAGPASSLRGRFGLTVTAKSGEHILRSRLRVVLQVSNFQAVSSRISGFLMILALSGAPASAQTSPQRAGEPAKAGGPPSAAQSVAAAPSGQVRPQSANKPGAAKSAAAKKNRTTQRADQAKPRAFEESQKPAQAPRKAAAVGAAVAVVGASAAASSDKPAAPRPAGGAEAPQSSAAPPAPARPSVGESIGLKRVADPLSLHSSVAVVVDARSGDVLVRKNPNAVLPIASITKLMTAMVVLDAGLPLGERLQITRDDIDRLRGTSSRLHPGATLTRAEMLQLALMSSENRAANALGRHYPGGMPAFVAAMNAKARSLGLRDTRFVEPTGLSSANVSTGGDLAQLTRAASAYPLIRQYSTARSLTVHPAREPLGFYNTNRLVSTAGWSIGMQKTGFISEAGNCLVMIANVDGRQLIFVLLDAAGKLARFGDAQRIRGWVEKSGPPPQRIHAESGSGDPAPLRVSHSEH